MNSIRSISLATISAVFLACAAPGTKPHDMSAAQHEAMAKNEDAAASEHAGQHDPSATKETTTCGTRMGGCWTSVSNPTAQHADDAKRHRELAQKHRAASTALTDAEARACAGLPEDDRDISPFYHREDIQSVSPFSQTVRAGKASVQKEVGVTVVFRAVPGLTAEWLQRVMDCHLARAAAVGHAMPEMPYCPLVPNGAKTKVTSTGNGFAVAVFADDAATVAEIKKRADALKGGAAAP